MPISRSCRYSTKAGLLFCLSFFLLLLRGVYSSKEQFPYENMEMKELLSPDTNPEIYNIMAILREIIKRQHQQQQQQQQNKENMQWTTDDNGEDLSDVPHPQYKLFPFPLLKQAEKKGTYMGPCHFKVCNLG